MSFLASLASFVCVTLYAVNAQGLGPKTGYTGHTGLVRSQASTTTLEGKTILEGAMIPRFCQADHVERPSSAAEVAHLIRHHKRKCEEAGKKLIVRASRGLYHASSDILCPETNRPEWNPEKDESHPKKRPELVAHPNKGSREEASVDRGRCSLILDTENMKWIGPVDREAMVVTTGPTLTYNVLMEHLYQMDLALDYRHLPFYSNLTMAGMLLTGAHGSSREKPSSFGQLVTRVDWVDASGNLHTTTDTKRFIGSNGLFGIITQMTMKLMPLVKIKSTVRRMHDFQLQQEIHNVLADPNLTLIHWLPDVFQAVIMTRESVPAKTKGTAEFQIVENMPLLSGPGALTMEINQFDNAKLGDKMILDDAALGIAETVLIPYYRDEVTKIPIPNVTPSIVGRLPVMASSDCVPGPDGGCFWRMIPINLVEVDMPIAVLPEFMNDVRLIVQKEVPTALPSVIGFATRFGAKSEGSPWDMASGADTAYIDIVTNKGPKQVDDPSSYQHVFDQIEQLAFCKYQARVHWGKNSNRAFLNPICPARYKYPEFDSILKEAKQYDPEGVFISPMLSRVIKPEAGVKTPGCAVRSECYCDEDWHCGQGHECVSGATFPEYKVCKFKHLSLRHRLSARIKDTVLGFIQGSSMSKSTGDNGGQP